MVHHVAHAFVGDGVGEVEAVDAGFVKPGFKLVGDLARIAHQHRAAATGR
jgi:hypothetical protein